jgi:Skp family chaperone for outer membrane proteins
MLKRVLVLAMVAGAMILVGCGEDGGGSSSGRVAVVDLNKILDDIGHRKKLAEAGQIRENNLRISVRVIQQKVQTQLVAMVEKIGDRPKPAVADTPTEAEKKALAEWVTKMQNVERTRQEATNQIRQRFAQQRQANQKAIQDVLAAIGKRIKPLAKRIAKDKGLDIVMTTNGMVSYDESIDITAEVFKEVNDLLKAKEFPTVDIPQQLQVKRVPASQPAKAPDPTTPAPKTP